MRSWTFAVSNILINHSSSSSSIPLISRLSGKIAGWLRNTEFWAMIGEMISRSDSKNAGVYSMTTGHWSSSEVRKKFLSKKYYHSFIPNPSSAIRQGGMGRRYGRVLWRYPYSSQILTFLATIPTHGWGYIWIVYILCKAMSRERLRVASAFVGYRTLNRTSEMSPYSPYMPMAYFYLLITILLCTTL